MKPLIIYIFLSLPILHVIDINDYHYTPISTSHIAETGSQRISSAIDKFTLPVGNILFVAILKAMVKNTKEVFDSYRSFLSNLFISRMVKSIRNHSQYAKQDFIEVSLSLEANGCAIYCSLMLSERPQKPVPVILIIAGAGLCHCTVYSTANYSTVIH